MSKFSRTSIAHHRIRRVSGRGGFIFFDCGGVDDAVDVIFLNAAQLICRGHNTSNANFRADRVVNGKCRHEHGVYGKVSIALIYRDAKGATALERLSCSALGTRR